MVLYDEDEQREKTDRRGKALLLLLVVIIAVGTMSFIWSEFRPLPQTKECKEQGFDGGKVLNNVMFCYRECEDNTVESCGFRSVVI